jgi:pre-mRNA-splicing factor ATP-dependent RNA helicase DHX38/PRP16
MHNYD